MATYKVWLTVKDRYGKTKELDGGAIDVDLEQVAGDIVDHIESNTDFISRSELEETIDSVVSEVKPIVYVPNVTPNNVLEFTLKDGDELKDDHLEFDIDKSNDWSEIDQTTGSNYVWEPMQ
jgi:hypothetical protein